MQIEVGREKFDIAVGRSNDNDTVPENVPFTYSRSIHATLSSQLQYRVVRERKFSCRSRTIALEIAARTLGNIGSRQISHVRHGPLADSFSTCKIILAG